MPAFGGNPTPWRPLSSYAQGIMDKVADLAGSGTMVIQGVAPAVTRNAAPYYVFDDLFAEQGVPNVCPAMRWRASHGVFSGDREVAGGLSYGPSSQDPTSGTLGTWSTTFEVNIFGRTGEEAFQEMTYLTWAINYFMPNVQVLPLDAGAQWDVVEVTADSGFKRAITFVFNYPVVIGFPPSGAVTVLTASSTIVVSGSIVKTVTVVSGSHS